MMGQKGEKIRTWRRKYLWVYRMLIMPVLAMRVRRKRVRSVVFLLSELGVWKTERLYREMLSDPRFDPHLLVIDSPENPDARGILEEYLCQRGYDYRYLSSREYIRDFFKPDIIFYQKPYKNVIPRHFRCRHNLLSLYCYVPYGFSSTMESWSINHYVHEFAWKIFFENADTVSDMALISDHGSRAFRATGLPMSDEYFRPALPLVDPWKWQDRSLKRIIWAPHHSIPAEGNWLNYSTFLDYCDFMLSLAHRYRGRAVFAFKPHPLLRHKLEARWGRERTDAYFAGWANGENTLIDEGDYLGLFMNSDALIHDCASFTIEYQYAHRPALYLNNGTDHAARLTRYAREAYNLHYMADSGEDVVSFVENVLSGIDPKSALRDDFVKSYLTPAGGSACRNILDELCR